MCAALAPCQYDSVDLEGVSHASAPHLNITHAIGGVLPNNQFHQHGAPP
jgi:hypothetical protein